MKIEVLLKELIQFETINDPARNLYPKQNILNYIEKKVQEWNSRITYQIFDNQEYGSIYFALNPKKVDILFMGHLDVVPVSQGWSSDPFTLKIDPELGLGYGRGAKDCKGSIASALFMLKKLSDKKSPLVERIGFFFSTDEETGGKYGAKAFFDYSAEYQILPKYVINVDGGSRVVHKRRAGFKVVITLPPKTSETLGHLQKQIFHTRILGDENRHSAYFVRGCDTHAIIALSKLLHLNRDWMIKDIDGSWVKGNVIPDNVEATIIKAIKKPESIQTTYDENLTKIIREIRNLVLLDLPQNIPSEFGVSVCPNIVSYSTNKGTKILFDVRAFLSDKEVLINAFKQRLGELASEAEIICPGTAGYFCTPKDNPLVIATSKILENHSLISEACEQEGASDSRYAFEHNLPVIDLGPKGGNVHGNDEFIDLVSMKEFASIYEEIVLSILHS